MKICVLGSGSGGNCTYIATAKARILVDLGFGRRSLDRRLQQAGLSLDGLDALLLTHEHTDHVSGVPALVRDLEVPAFMTGGTLRESPALQEVDRTMIVPVGVPFQIGDLEVEALPVSHDAAQPVGFRFAADGIQGLLATDLGEPTPEITEPLADCDWLILESNHDEEMVLAGPYPWLLKQRLMGPKGHLSNHALGRCLKTHLGDRTKHIFLAHMSRTNNHPQLALEQVSAALSGASGSGESGPRVHLTHQNRPSIVLSL